MQFSFRRFGAVLCAAAVGLSALPTTAQAATYAGRDEVTSHVSLAVPQTLNITKPADDITTTAAYYYIMGTSDPSQQLIMGADYVVPHRGQYGSFGVYVPLAQGKNIIRFSQGGKTVSLTITRSTGGTVSTTKVISEAFPTYDTAYFAEDKVSLSCVAPSGASVTAMVNGRTIELKQVAAAQAGVAARFRGDYTMPNTNEGTVSLGHVSYTMQYNGNTSTVSSAGYLLTNGAGSDLVVECTQVSAGVVKGPGQEYIATAKLGAVDRVVDYNDSLYELSMGGWISRANVQPLTGDISVDNTVQSIVYRQEQRAEIYAFKCNSNAFAQSWQSADKLTVRLYNTVGIGNFSTENSRLYSSVSVTANNDGSTTLVFTLNPDATLWGHTVWYGDGEIQIISKYKPTLTGSSSQPLRGIVVALDSGHGSKDPGALGIAQLTGPTESVINRATAITVQKYLEAMGATVLLPDELDLNSRFNPRMQPAVTERADVFISLHCNSIAANANGLTPNGIEIYYYEGIGKPLGDAILPYMVSTTGRSNRGVKFYEFRVTLNSLAPSVLIEMGFMTNPIEYDNLCSRSGMYNTAVAIGDGLVRLLSA